jgi:hypothetical protein
MADLLSMEHKTGSVQLLGYHERGDGGGGVFYWDATADKAEHNGGTIIDPDVVFPTDWNNQGQLAAWFTAGSGTGCWVREYSGAVNVKWFGAVGDGVSDDTTALKSAIKLFNVYIPAGIYLINGSLQHIRTDEQGLSIIGESSELVTIKQSGAFDTIQIKRTDANYTHIKGVKLQGFTIDNDGIGFSGILFYSSWFNSIEDVKIKYCTQSAIYFDGDTNKNPDATATALTTIRNSSLENNLYGIFNLYNNNAPLLYCETVRILNNTKGGAKGNSSYWQFKNCSVSFNGSDTATAEGGIVNMQCPSAVTPTYQSKGWVIETTELDSNYPVQVDSKTLQSSIVRNCSIQLATNYFTLPEFPQGFLIRVGGDGTGDKCLGLSIENNRMSINNLDATVYNATASMIYIDEGAVSPLLDNNTWVASDGFGGAGTNYYLIDEADKSLSVNWSGFDDYEYYAKISNNSNIPYTRQLAGFSLQTNPHMITKTEDHSVGYVIADDDVLVIPVNPSTREASGAQVWIGSYQVITNNPVAFSALGLMRAQAFPQNAPVFSGNLTDTTTGVLTGTTGIDTHLTVSVADDNKLYIENRTGNIIYVNVYMNNSIKLMGG